MGAGGTVENNVDSLDSRQFAGEGGAAAKPKRDKSTVSGIDVEIIDLAGTYKDSPGGPFAGGKNRHARQLTACSGAIVQTKDRGNYFLKLYGPKATIDENEKGFQEMVKSLTVK